MNRFAIGKKRVKCAMAFMETCANAE